MKRTTEQVKDDADRMLRKFTFYVHPEWKTPKHNTEGCNWYWTGEETMHPFWAVRRLTQQELKKEEASRGPGQLPLRFNCELVEKEISNVTVLTMPEVSNRTRVVSVQWLTNSVPLVENEELILEIGKPKANKPDNKRSWRDVHKEEVAAKAKAKAKTVAKKAPNKSD